MNFSCRITELKGIGEKNALLFQKLNIETLGELVHHFPRDFETYQDAWKICQLPDSGRAAFLGRITKEPSLLHKNGKSILSFPAEDETGSVKITYFNMPYLKKTLKPGSIYVFSGNVHKKGGQCFMEQPKLFKPEEYAKLVGSLQPIYAKTKGLSNDTLKKYIKKALEAFEDIPEHLPCELIEKYGFPTYIAALKAIHNPDSREEMVLARKRLAYEEFFFFILSIKYLKEDLQAKENSHAMIPTAHTERLIEALPYRLTDSQKKAWKEIEEDLCGGGTLNRLLQGDVGSGKTIIAVLSLLLCVSNGYQGALMAPTEVLALQHYETISRMTKEYGLPFLPVLLVGSLTAKGKREAKEKIREGGYNLIIGTHALIEDNVEFQKLALVVTDEQHRFGVAQREKLTKKGGDVHTLVMSATPIPRSLAIILYGELAVSTIPELPKNRLPIKNCVVGTSFRKKAYEFIEAQVREGRQAYIICPMVESGVMDELENVVDYTKNLKKELNAAIQIGYLHGKMPSAKKNQIMEEFSKGNLQVLVSTTVIEVGINVPNATVMMVENADRFGLAALHQLRGRVGRGSHQSYCIFIDTKENDRSKERLDILNHSNDGFFIANEDLRLRGPGDLLGILQSGSFSFRIADIYTDAQMLTSASGDVNRLLKEDRTLSKESHVLLKNRLLTQMEREHGKTI
ncbi:MAG: ATP-dependent DNA helicase RecG [Roseburia sp.]|nr:ATP-dependent DNA helicase RecG [Roseburia sp.]MCM1279552.1 ATP-dependent DNA helicase RecG [Robinsoniella sp.]